MLPSDFFGSSFEEISIHCRFLNPIRIHFYSNLYLTLGYTADPIQSGEEL